MEGKRVTADQILAEIGLDVERMAQKVEIFMETDKFRSD
jgi:hypothetical protein